MPLPPDKPVYTVPANLASGQPLTGRVPDVEAGAVGRKGGRLLRHDGDATAGRVQRIGLAQHDEEVCAADADCRSNLLLEDRQQDDGEAIGDRAGVVVQGSVIAAGLIRGG